MKKILFAIGILAGLLTATQNVQAQDKAKDKTEANAQTQDKAKFQIRFGIKAGVNLSTFDYDGWSNIDTKAGIFFGPMLDMTLPLWDLGLDVAAMYSKRGNEDYEQAGLEVPINLKYNFDLTNYLGFFVAVGPDLYFNFKENEKHSSLERNICQLGLNLGGGVKIIQHIVVSANYQWGLIKTYRNMSNDEGAAKTNTCQIAVAYIF